MRSIVAVLVVGLAACASANDARLAGDGGGTDAPADAAPVIEDAPMATVDACVPGAELCDGIDNDCDTKIDEDFHIGQPCDGADADTCADGVTACATTNTTTCTDGPDDSPEICDGNDNDCDGAIDEGFAVGTACDGGDSDACFEGLVVCDGSGGTTCNDATTDSIERCNGLDDDCQNGPDDTFPVGQACTVGLGSCARSGAYVCNAAQTGVACNATAGAPLPELCGNGVDEDCNGSDAACPTNDLPTGAIDISAGGTFTVDLTTAHDDNWIQATGFDCGNQGGRDVFYQFTLPAAEVVYFDSFGSNFDSVLRVFAGSCPALGAIKACADDACSGTRSADALELPAGTYCLVLDQFSATTTAGSATLKFTRGGRPGTRLAGTSGSVSGTTTGKTDLSVAGCEANSHQPDVGYFFLTCPGQAAAVSASTCTGTAFDSILSLRNGSAASVDVACSDDEASCGNNLQSKITSAAVSVAGLHWLIVDGFGQTGNGPFTLTYSIQ